jgi:hypothetical protein
VLHHDNARPHTNVRTQALLEHFNWELFDYPPYSPDLAPSDHHLFTYLKNWLGSQRSNNNEVLMKGVKTWLSSQSADIFDTGIKERIPRLTSASVLEVTTLRSSLSMHVFFVHNKFIFSLLVSLTAHRGVLSEYIPSFMKIGLRDQSLLRGGYTYRNIDNKLIS